MLDSINFVSRSRGVFGLAAVLMLGLATGVEADELIIPPSLEEMISDEVYQSMYAIPPVDDEVWQKPQSEEKSSVTWGYDPFYEEIFKSGNSQRYAGNYDQETPKAANQFRLEF